MLLSIMVLGIALSMDGFAVGLSYGIGKILTPVRSLLIIMICSGGIIFISMSIGEGIKQYVSPQITELIGGLLLISIGVWIIYQSLENKILLVNDETIAHQKIPIVIEPHQLQIIFEIIKKPFKADLDKSGLISTKEAFLLGFALSLDAFGAGIGAAFMGYPILWTTIIIAFMSGMFVFFGIIVGTKFAKIVWIQKAKYLPGLLLIMIGIFNIF